MNIAILIPTLGGGGAERAAQILGNYYIERGNKVYYFLADTDETRDYLVKGEIVQTNIKRCTDRELVQRICWMLISSLRARIYKWRYKIDVSISFMEEFNYINILSKGKEKVIATIHCVLSEYEKQYADNWIYKKNVITFFYRMTDVLVVLSKRAFDEMKFYYGIPTKKIVKIPNMVTSDSFIKLDNKEWYYGKKAVICVGRLHYEKNQDRIIRAFSYVCEREPDSRLIILGQGEQLYYLKKLAEKLQIKDNVVFLGFTQDIMFYLQHARVFVMASKVDCFPNSMLEAMNCGVPVITTDSPGGCGEIVGKPHLLPGGGISAMTFCKYGILTPRMRDEKLKFNSLLTKQEIILGEAMLKVITEDEIYLKYKKKSLQRAKMYSIDSVIKRWNFIIEG